MLPQSWSPVLTPTRCSWISTFPFLISTRCTSWESEFVFLTMWSGNGYIYDHPNKLWVVYGRSRNHQDKKKADTFLFGGFPLKVVRTLLLLRNLAWFEWSTMMPWFCYRTQSVSPASALTTICARVQKARALLYSLNVAQCVFRVYFPCWRVCGRFASICSTVSFCQDVFLAGISPFFIFSRREDEDDV